MIQQAKAESKGSSKPATNGIGRKDAVQAVKPQEPTLKDEPQAKPTDPAHPAHWQAT